MNKPKFTPGPWKAKGLTIFHMEPEKDCPKNTLANGYVCSCFSTRDWDGMKEEAQANAKLIALAPEMYLEHEQDIEFLSALFLLISNECTPTLVKDAIKIKINKKKILLKKARGE